MSFRLPLRNMTKLSAHGIQHRSGGRLGSMQEKHDNTVQLIGTSHWRRFRHFLPERLGSDAPATKATESRRCKQTTEYREKGVLSTSRRRGYSSAAVGDRGWILLAVELHLPLVTRCRVPHLRLYLRPTILNNGCRSITADGCTRRSPSSALRTNC